MCQNFPWQSCCMLRHREFQTLSQIEKECWIKTENLAAGKKEDKYDFAQLQQRNLTVCALETSGRNIIPGLPERMVCSWKDCMVSWFGLHQFDWMQSQFCLCHQDVHFVKTRTPGCCREGEFKAEVLFQIQFDDPNDFYNHTSKHQEQFPDGNFVQGGCKCGWIGKHQPECWMGRFGVVLSFTRCF